MDVIPRALVHRHCGLIRFLHLRVLLQPASKMKKANAAHCVRHVLCYAGRFLKQMVHL